MLTNALLLGSLCGILSIISLRLTDYLRRRRKKAAQQLRSDEELATALVDKCLNARQNPDPDERAIQLMAIIRRNKPA